MRPEPHEDRWIGSTLPDAEWGLDSPPPLHPPRIGRAPQSEQNGTSFLPSAQTPRPGLSTSETVAWVGGEEGAGWELGGGRAGNQTDPGRVPAPLLPNLMTSGREHV